MLCELKHFKSVSWILITLLVWHYGGGLTYAQNHERAKLNPRTPKVARVAAPPAAHEDLQFDTVLSELKETLGAKETPSQDGQVTSAAKAPKKQKGVRSCIVHQSSQQGDAGRHGRLARPCAGTGRCMREPASSGWIATCPTPF
jgi:hypothetical protein